MKKLLIMIIVLLLSTPAFGAILEWDNNETADYYIVYGGDISGNYTEQSEQITETSYVVENPKKFYAVKAFNSCGNSSDFSDEVEFCPVVTESEGVRFRVEVDVKITIMNK